MLFVPAKGTLDSTVVNTNNALPVNTFSKFFSRTPLLPTLANMPTKVQSPIAAFGISLVDVRVVRVRHISLVRFEDCEMSSVHALDCINS